MAGRHRAQGIASCHPRASNLRREAPMSRGLTHPPASRLVTDQTSGDMHAAVAQRDIPGDSSSPATASEAPHASTLFKTRAGTFRCPCSTLGERGGRPDKFPGLSEPALALAVLRVLLVCRVVRRVVVLRLERVAVVRRGKPNARRGMRLRGGRACMIAVTRGSIGRSCVGVQKPPIPSSTNVLSTMLESVPSPEATALL